MLDERTRTTLGVMPTDPFSKLAEARIQEWNRRPASERQVASPEALSLEPLEMQLLQDARALYARARSATDATEAERLRQEAAHLETRIMVLLEASGRPLAAEQFARMLLEARTSG